MKHKVSIIVPVFNIESYIGACLESILTQTYKNFEVIIINDGSTDKSGEICSQYARLDSRIKVINQEYSGVSVARNVGVNVASGEYIGFVDGDDRIEKNMYMELFNLSKQTKSDIAICKLGREIHGKLINIGEELFIKEMNNNEL